MTNAIETRLCEIMEAYEESLLRDAMKYSLFAGGKRLRPKLILSACESVCGSYENALDFACAAEMIHTYSLIHDDLPAMDDDDLRRGRPTCHIKFGEAVAILAGDALLNAAYEVMIGACGPNIPRHNEAMRIIARASGAYGMVAGQALDMIYEKTQVSGDMLNRIHYLKTGRLIAACFSAGAVIGGASGGLLDTYEKMGDLTGLLFQIKDDILDVTSTREIMGKSVASDGKNQKNTYVSVYGLSRALEDYKRLSGELFALSGCALSDTSPLYKLITQIIEREH